MGCFELSARIYWMQLHEFQWACQFTVFYSDSDKFTYSLNQKLSWCSISQLLNGQQGYGRDYYTWSITSIRACDDNANRSCDNKIEDRIFSWFSWHSKPVLQFILCVVLRVIIVNQIAVHITALEASNYSQY